MNTFYKEQRTESEHFPISITFQNESESQTEHPDPNVGGNAHGYMIRHLFFEELEVITNNIYRELRGLIDGPNTNINNIQRSC